MVAWLKDIANFALKYLPQLETAVRIIKLWKSDKQSSWKLPHPSWQQEQSCSMQMSNFNAWLLQHIIVWTNGISIFKGKSCTNIHWHIFFLMCQRIEVTGQAIAPQKGYTKGAYWKWKALLEHGKDTILCVTDLVPSPGSPMHERCLLCPVFNSPSHLFY